MSRKGLPVWLNQAAPNVGAACREGGWGTLPREPSAPEIRLPQAFVLAQVRGLALEDEAPGREHVAAVCDRERDVRVLLDDEHGDARLVDLLDDLEGALDEDRLDA